MIAPMMSVAGTAGRFEGPMKAARLRMRASCGFTAKLAGKVSVGVR